MHDPSQPAGSSLASLIDALPDAPEVTQAVVELSILIDTELGNWVEVRTAYIGTIPSIDEIRESPTCESLLARAMSEIPTAEFTVQFVI